MACLAVGPELQLKSGFSLAELSGYCFVGIADNLPGQPKNLQNFIIFHKIMREKGI